jgi:hypothetical protein
MKPVFAPFSALLLAACVSGGGAPPPGADPAPDPSDTCGIAASGVTAGMSSFEALQIFVPRTTAQPPTARVIFPDTAITMDFRQDRLNAEIGADDLVARIFCG